MINLALIGAGRWGKNYLRAVKNIPRVSIKYVCSSVVSLRSISSEYIKVSDYRELAKKKDLDGVIVAVPAIRHFEIAKFFLLAGKTVLVEKPMTVSLKEAEQLKIVFDKTNGRMMVGNIFLYNEAFMKFAKLFHKMTNICYLHFEACDWGPIRNDVSALWDWAPHDISMCLSIMGSKPVRVSAWAVNSLRPSTNLFDMIYARLFFEKSVSAFFRIGWLSPFKKREILAVGEKESLLFDDISSKKVTHFDNLLRKTDIDYPKSEPLVKELESFIGMIREKKIPIINFDRNFAVIEVIDAMEKSIQKSGSIVEIK